MGYNPQSSPDGSRTITGTPKAGLLGGTDLATLHERYEKGQSMRAQLAAGDPTLFTVPGIDQLAQT